MCELQNGYFSVLPLKSHIRISLAAHHNRKHKGKGFLEYVVQHSQVDTLQSDHGSHYTQGDKRSAKKFLSLKK